MNNKRLIIILSIFTVIFTLMGGTLAYYNWQSADNKKTNVSFTVNSDYSCSADSGGHITSSDVSLVPAKCTDSVYAIKRTIRTSVITTNDKVVSMDLWLNVNSIDSNLANSPNFKWVITKNGNTCNGAINHGTFQNIENNKIVLLNDAEYATLNDKYYLYIWLDEAETNSNTMNQSFDFSIGGYCEDTGKEKALLKNLNTTDYFREADYKTVITDIAFIYDEDLPSGITTNNEKTYDLGANASKPITGYLIENTDQGADPGTYKLYVSSEYKIYAQSLNSAFDGMSGLKNISFENLDTSGSNSMYRTFYNCNSLSTLDLSTFNTSKVGSMGWMFSGCSALQSLNVSGFDTSGINNNNYSTNAMFQNCSSLSSLDVTSFDMSTARNITQMFNGCSGLTSLDLTYFVPSYANSFSSLFQNCSGLTSLDLSSFVTTNVTNTASMFYGCSNLTEIVFGTNFNTSNVNNMTSMFEGCSNLTTLDLSMFDTTSISETTRMFNNCQILSTIYVSDLWNVQNATGSTNMFNNCYYLPHYNASFKDKTKAYYGTDGYLTYKAYTPIS